MRVLLTIWDPKTDEVRELINLPLSDKEVDDVKKGNISTINKLFRNTVKAYTKIPASRINYNSIHKCASVGGTDTVETIVKVKFIELAPKTSLYD